MNHVCGMKGFESSEGLVDEILTMVVGKILSSNDSMNPQGLVILTMMMIRITHRCISVSIS
jgi:hypothetical protein